MEDICVYMCYIYITRIVKVQSWCLCKGKELLFPKFEGTELLVRVKGVRSQHMHLEC